MMFNFLACKEKTEESYEKIFEVLLQNFRDIEIPKRPCLALEDKRALEISNKTVEKVENHYSMGLLWREDNRRMALKRLEEVKKRLFNNPKFFETYCERINKYLMPVENNSCVLPGRINYIPHHSVI